MKQNDVRATHVVVDLKAIRDNARNLKAMVGDRCKLMAVVKADGYGHGATEVSKAALDGGADMLAVAIPEEGRALRRAGIRAPILVLGGIDARGARIVAQNHLQQTVYDAATVRMLQAEAVRANEDIAVHVKLDTGMNRVGVKEPDETHALMQMIDACSRVHMVGAYSHFASADEDEETYARMQFAVYHYALPGVLSWAKEPVLCHMGASAAAMRLPETRMDLVRCGIALYGYYPSKHVPRACELTPALTWVTRVVHVKLLDEGENVSYGCMFTAARPTKLATIAVGYGDGYKRNMTYKAKVLINGHRAPVVGRICMDMCMVDVTDLPGDVQVGSEVVLIGKQGDECISADELAVWADTISYEILLSIMPRVPRVYVDGEG